MPSGASAYVVIPAHNEGSTIRDGLRCLLEGAASGEIEVIVVANACTDDTARSAAAEGVRAVATDVPGKSNALRIGDRLCTGFPRIYLDADIQIDIGVVRAIVRTMAADDVLACSPELQLDLQGVGPVARRVHRVHEALTRPHRGLAGIGVYALSERGHARVFPLPDVIADDELVHRTFAPHERRVATGVHSVVRPAPTVRAHLRRRARVRLGNHQLAEMGLTSPSGSPSTSMLRDLVSSGYVSRWDAGWYLAVTALDRARFAIRSRRAPTGGAWSSERVSTSHRGA